MLVCNIGHGNIESIDLIKKGNDYGWPIREGTFALNPYGDLNKVYPMPANDSSYHITEKYCRSAGNSDSSRWDYC